MYSNIYYTNTFELNVPPNSSEIQALSKILGILKQKLQ